MSVKNEYETLQQKEATLQREVKTVEKNFAAKKQEWQELLEKKKLLLERSSELAKRFLSDVEDQISEAEVEKKETYEALQRLRGELESVQKRVRELEDNPQEYVKEQSRNMAQQLEEYVRTHEEELGRAFTSVMTIKAQKEEEPDRYGSYWIPTGNILIVDQQNNSLVESSEFYIRKALYEFKRDDWYDNVSICITEWFSEYLKLFYQALRREIEETFKGHPNFKVEFTDMTHFTIELR